MAWHRQRLTAGETTTEQRASCKGTGSLSLSLMATTMGNSKLTTWRFRQAHTLGQEDPPCDNCGFLSYPFVDSSVLPCSQKSSWPVEFRTAKQSELQQCSGRPLQVQLWQWRFQHRCPGCQMVPTIHLEANRFGFRWFIFMAKGSWHMFKKAKRNKLR